MTFYDSVLTQVGIAVLLALGYWVGAVTGRYSFGHAGFMAIGAYAASILTVNFAWSLPAAMLVAGAAAAVAGAFIGWIALRLSMLYLAIVTFIFGQLVITLLSLWDYVGGAAGFIGPSGTTVALVVASVLTVIAYLLLLTRSRLGLAYAAIREDGQASAASGLSVTRIAVGAFATSAAITGIAGALSAHSLFVISPSLYGPSQALLVILYVVFGGVQYFWGAIVGAVVLATLPIYVDFLSDWYLIVYGLLFVFMMIVRPQGLIGRAASTNRPLLARLLDAWRSRRKVGDPVG